MSESLLDVGHPPWTQGEQGTIWPLSIHSQAYANALVVKSGPGKLYGFSVYNSGAAQFILMLDAAAVQATGFIPCAAYAVAATANLGVYFGDTGRTFQTGIVICNSSTAPTLTAGAADSFIDAQYL